MVRVSWQRAIRVGGKIVHVHRDSCTGNINPRTALRKPRISNPPPGKGSQAATNRPNRQRRQFHSPAHRKRRPIFEISVSPRKDPVLDATINAIPPTTTPNRPP